MESFLPTEIARLVYGYLIEENCDTAAQLFLETSVHLKECLMVTKKGRRFNTRVSGYNLVDILDKLCEVTCIVKEHIDQDLEQVAPENALLLQLKALLIPNEEKKIKFRQSEPSKNSLDNSLNESLSTKPIDNDSVEEKNNINRQVHPVSELAAGPQNENCQENRDTTVHEVRVLGNPENNDHYNCNSNLQIIPRTNEYPQTSDEIIHGDDNATNSDPEKLNALKYFAEEMKVIDKKVDGKNLVRIDVEKMKSSIITGKSSGVSKSILNNTSVELSPSPVSVQQICHNESSLTNVKVVVNTVPNLQLSLLNHEETSQESDPMTAAYSLIRPFVPGPATFYIKPQAKNPLTKNIFTYKNRPVEKSETLILPKPIATANDGNNSYSPVIKRSGVRTRGGFVKAGGKSQRRVKAHVPNRVVENVGEKHSTVTDDPKICEQSRTHLYNIPLAENEKSLLPLIKETNLVENISSVDVTSTTSELLQSSNVQTLTDTVVPEKTERPSRNLRKRISLSVPRRGSHIRALDFKTPTKGNLYIRRAITSPKQMRPTRSPLKKSLRCVRGTLFKSPFKKENKAWDADLRKYTSESRDIPSSVGLQRKSNTQAGNDTFNDQKEPDFSEKESICEISSPMNITLLKNEETNEDLAVKIQKEVLSVIGEEEINLIGENSNLICDTGLHEIIISNVRRGSTTSSKAEGNSETQMTDYQNTDDPRSDNLENKSYKTHNDQVIDRLANIFEAEEKENLEIPSDSASLLTPLSKAIQEHREILEKGLLTPGTPSIAKDFSISESPKDDKYINCELSPIKVGSPFLNLACQDSLEASLIKECKRIEKENLVQSIEEKEKENAELKKTESMFDTPQKSTKDLGYEGSSFFSDKSPKMTSCTNKEAFHSADKSYSANISTSETHVTHFSEPVQLFEEPFGQTPNICSSSLPIIPLSNDKDKTRINRRGMSVNYNSSSAKHLSVIKNKSKADSEAEGDKNEEINSSSEEQRNNSGIEKSIDEEDCKIYKADIVDFGLHKARSLNCEKNGEINCGKLIAQCLQSVKENLYGTEKESGSMMKTNKEQQNKSDKKVKNTSNNNAKERGFHSRIKNINELLFSDSSFSSEDSDKLEMQQGKSERSGFANSDECSTSLKVKLNNQSSSPSPEKLVTSIKSGAGIVTDRSKTENKFLRSRKINDLETTRNESKKKICSLVSSGNEPSVHKSGRYETRKEKDMSEIELSQVTKDSYSEYSTRYKRVSPRGKTDDSLLNVPNNLQKKKCSTGDTQNDNTTKQNESPAKGTKKCAEPASEGLKMKDKVNETLKVKGINGSKQSFSKTSAKYSSAEDTSEAMEVKDKVNEASKVINCNGSKQSISETSVKSKNAEALSEGKKMKDKVNEAPKVKRSSENKQSPSVTSVKNCSDHEYDSKILQNDATNIHKNNIEQLSNTSEKLSNYVYTFTLTLDGKNVTKQLKLSPYYSIFELETSLENSEGRNTKKSNRESHSLTSIDSQERSRKRKVSSGNSEASLINSFGDEKKFTPTKKHKIVESFSYKKPSYARNERHRIAHKDRNKDTRLRRSFRSREKTYLRENYSRKYLNEYTSPRFRRYPPPRRWATRRRIGEVHQSKGESPKWSSYGTKDAVYSDASHRYKDRSDSKKHEDLKTTNEFNSRNQNTNDGENSRTASVHSTRSSKDKKKKRIPFDKEDGEISESSISVCSLKPKVKSTSSNSQRAITNLCDTLPVDEDTRAKLKKINLDHFLSLLHGTEE